MWILVNSTDKVLYRQIKDLDSNLVYTKKNKKPLMYQPDDKSIHHKTKVKDFKSYDMYKNKS
jgi:hypothetical protein